MGCLIGGETDRTKDDYIIYDFSVGPAMKEVPNYYHCRWGDLKYSMNFACCGSIRTLGREGS